MSKDKVQHSEAAQESRDTSAAATIAASPSSAYAVTKIDKFPKAQELHDQGYDGYFGTFAYGAPLQRFCVSAGDGKPRLIGHAISQEEAIKAYEKTIAGSRRWNKGNK